MFALLQAAQTTRLGGVTPHAAAPQRSATTRRAGSNSRKCGSQIDPPDAILELLFHRTGHREGQARFTGTAGTNEREQARRLEHLRDLDDFTLPADEAREPGWQIRVPAIHWQCVRQCLAQNPGKAEVVITEAFGLAVVGAPLSPMAMGK